jgi:hypothetical protein
VWGFDLVRPLKKALRGFMHLCVTVDKFTKWIEARPIEKSRTQEVVQFFNDIIHHFRVPNLIITDKGTQITGKNSSISTMNSTFKWTGPLSPIQRPIGR